MALRGTLKDFGIADIFQLIGNQNKTGKLTLKNRNDTVQVSFRNGHVVKAHSVTRKRKELFGDMLVRAEIITPAQLENALTAQRNTLKRLGDILFEAKVAQKQVLQDFARLQTTETLYRLFLWDSGSYRFENHDVEDDGEFPPVRSENILMEGFRQVDEWPALRKKVDSYNLRFKKIKEMDSAVVEDDFDDLDAAFGAFDDFGGGSKKKKKDTGPAANERTVYSLITSEHDVQKLIDLSRLGEFETCKSIATLIKDKYIVIHGKSRRKPSAAATVGGITGQKRHVWIPLLANLVLVGSLIGAGGWAFLKFDLARFQPSGIYHREQIFQDNRLLSLLHPAHEEFLRDSLEVYKAAYGNYPKTLALLASSGIIREDDLRFPWTLQYDYHLLDTGKYKLLRPFY